MCVRACKAKNRRNSQIVVFFHLFFLLQTSFKKVSFVINLNPIEDLFQLVEDELLMKLTTLEEGTKGIIKPPLRGDFSVATDWNTTLSQVDFQFSNY